MLKAIVDVNVWVSALLNPGNARKIQAPFEHGQFQLVICPQVVSEYGEVLARPKFAMRIQPEQRNRLIALIRKEAVSAVVE